MKLFEVVPGNFFSILSSGNREIYFDALMILHEMFKDELNIRVDDYISSLIAILEDRVFVLEEEDDAQEGGTSLSSKARIILNRLIKTGWVDKEFMDSSFIEIVTPRSYAIPLLKLLSEIGANNIQEYNSLVFATYSGLKQALSEDQNHLYEAILSARSNTEQLQYALRTLYHSIRGLLRGIAPQQEVNMLLQDHFNDFGEISDRVYHPIKTMDSVHRYMVPIHSLLADIMNNEAHMQSVRERAMVIQKSQDAEQSSQEVLQAMDYVLDFYKAVGGLVSEIDRKHSNYTKSSIEKIQYLMTADQTIKGKLAEILKIYAGKPEDERDGLAEIMETHTMVGRQEFFDARSLYHKNSRSRRVDREPLTIEQDTALWETAGEDLLKQLNIGYPVTRIRAFVEALFADGKKEIFAKDIPINSDTDFILLILAVIRQKERGMPYTVEMKSGRVERNGYVIPDLVIRRKGG